MIFYFDLRKTPMFRPYFEASGIHHQSHYRNKLMLALHRTKLRHVLPNRVLFQGARVPSGDDKIIVFDSMANPGHVRRLRLQNPGKRVILWFWNPVPGPDLLKEFGDDVEIWTYSPRDSRRYGLRLNTQFYFDCLAEEAASSFREPKAEKPKVFFIGREKGRGLAIREIAGRLEDAGAETNVQLLETPKGKHLIALREDLLPYSEVIRQIRDADILLDYYLDPEGGMSLRPMEALFWGKKLITNQSSIREQDFYDPNNIYVLGEERPLEEFFRAPYRKPDPAVRDRYLISSWLKRFDD